MECNILGIKRTDRNRYTMLRSKEVQPYWGKDSQVKVGQGWTHLLHVLTKIWSRLVGGCRRTASDDEHTKKEIAWTHLGWTSLACAKPGAVEVEMDAYAQ